MLLLLLLSSAHAGDLCKEMVNTQSTHHLSHHKRLILWRPENPCCRRGWIVDPLTLRTEQSSQKSLVEPKEASSEHHPTMNKGILCLWIQPANLLVIVKIKKSERFQTQWSYHSPSFDSASSPSESPPSILLELRKASVYMGRRFWGENSTGYVWRNQILSWQHRRLLWKTKQQYESISR